MTCAVHRTDARYCAACVENQRAEVADAIACRLKSGAVSVKILERADACVTVVIGIAPTSPLDLPGRIKDRLTRDKPVGVALDVMVGNPEARPLLTEEAIAWTALEHYRRTMPKEMAAAEPYRMWFVAEDFDRAMHARCAFCRHDIWVCSQPIDVGPLVVYEIYVGAQEFDDRQVESWETLSLRADFHALNCALEWWSRQEKEVR